MDYGEKSREDLVLERDNLLRRLHDLEDVQSRLDETERALEESQLLLEQLGGYVRQFFFLRSRDHVLYVGPAYEKVFGRSPEELHRDGNAFLKYVHGADRDRVRAAMAATTFQEGKSFDEEYRVVLPDGSLRWVWSRSFPVKNSEGEVYRQVGLAEDITERKRSEELLRKRALQQEAVSEIGQWALSDMSLSELMQKTTERISVTLDAELCKVLELVAEKDELLVVAGVGWREGVVGHSVVGCGKDSQAGYTLSQSQPVVVRDLQSETRFTGPSLLIDYGVKSGISVIIHGLDRPYGVLGVHTRVLREFDDNDVHFLQSTANILAATIEQRKAHEHSRKNEERFRRFAEEASVEGILIHDDSTILDANSRFASMHGYETSEIIGKHTLSTIAPECRDDVRRRIRNGYEEAYETTALRKDGLRFPIEIHARPIVFEDRAVRAAAVRDISERKKTEIEITKSKETIESIINATDDLVFLHSAESRIMIANKALARHFGLSQDEMIGKSMEDLLPQDIAASHRVRLRQVLETGKSVRFRDRRAETEFDNHFYPIFGPKGVVWAVAGVVQDITEQIVAEGNLRKAKLRLERAQEVANLGSWEWDIVSGSISASDETFRIFGYTRHEVEMTYDFFISTLHVEDRSRIKVVLEDAIANRRRFSEEFRITRPDGAVRVLQSIGRIAAEEEGKPSLMIGAVLDITERKAAEETLRISEERFRNFFEYSPVPYFIYDVHGRLLDVNQSMLDLFGYTKEEMLKLSYEDTHPDRGRARSVGRGAFETVLLTGQARFEGKFTKKTGEEFVGDVFASKANIGGEVVVLGTAIDVSQRRQAEKDLNESKARYRQLAEVTFEAVLFHDRGILLDANDQFYEMFGYEPEELRGKQKVGRLLTPESVVLARERAESQSTDTYELVGVRKDGTEFPIEVRVRLRHSEGGSARALAVRDLTERKDMEKRLIEAQKMEAVGTLAGGIAHDFNNILQVISGHAELMEWELASKGMKFSEMDAIHHAAQRGADLVQQILTFSRKVESKFQVIDLNKDIRNVERLLYRTIPKMIDIELLLADEPMHIHADPTQVEQILLNLAINAKDAMPKGGKLTIATQCVSMEGQYHSGREDEISGPYVLLTVSDNGHGMSQDVLSHIFEPFYTTKGYAEGTGLGLATVYGIVRLHGGHIDCESEREKGTVFSLYFPLAQPVEPDLEPLPDDREIPGGEETILVVDDEQLIVDLAKKILLEAGYSVITASSGKEALEIYAHRQTHIDLVILDLIMPEMGGEECLKGLIKIDPRVKALIASGFAITGNMRTFLHTEANGTVSKPFQMKDLLRSVRTALDRT